MPDRKLFADEIELRLDHLLMLSLRQRSATEVARTLEPLPRAAQESVLEWVAVAAQTSTELGLRLAAGAAEQFEVMGGEAFGDLVGSSVGDPIGQADADPLEHFKLWAVAGMDAFDTGGTIAAAATWAARTRDAKSRRRRYGDGNPRVARSVSFAVMEPRLARMAQALAGRPMALAVAAEAHTDTETLWLPAQLEVLQSAEDNAGLYTVLVAMLWAQTRFGTFEILASDLDAQLAASGDASVNPADRSLVLEWLALFEAMRLESRIAAGLPGLGARIAALRGPWPETLAAAATALAQAQAGVADSLRHALATAANPNAVALPHLPYRFVLDFPSARRVWSGRQSEAAKVVKTALNVIRGAGGGGQSNPDFPPLASEGVGPADDAQGDLVSLPADASSAGEQRAPSIDGEPMAGFSPAGAGVWQPVDAVDADSTLAISRKPDALYDEWDYRRRAWRRNWCQLYESDATPGDLAWVQETRQRNLHLIRSIRRRFESLRGEDRIHRRQREGEDLDLDAQVEAHADRKSGIEPSQQLFCHRRRSERSLAVMFMVDMSGSTKGWVNDAERESLVLLCEAIEGLGDRHAIYGFSGWTRSRCDIYRIKAFDAPYDAATQARIAGIEAKDYTRMGVAVRHLSRLLAAQPARHKLLVTLSDGRPDDYGDEYRGYYGIEDTRRALHQARAQGIRSYCVTIDRHGADYLPQLYGPAHYAVIDDAKKLPQKLAEIYRKLTS